MLKAKKNIQEPDSLFRQALLDPKTHDLFYVLDSCYRIVSERNLINLYKTILNESLECLHARQGAFYLYIKNEERFELADYSHISKDALHHWENINEYSKDELLISDKAFFETSQDRKVDMNSIIIPVHLRDMLYAVIRLSQKEDIGKFSKYDLNTANHMISFMNTAVENAEEISKNRTRSLRLHNKKVLKSNYFYEYFSNELRRSKRYRKTFSLIYLEIEDFDLIKENIKQECINRFVENLIEKLCLVIRETDFIAEEREARYFIMLPETDYFGSLITIRKIDSCIADELFINDDRNTLPVSIRYSSASFPKDGESKQDIFKTLSTRFEDAKKSIIEKLDVKKAAFWDTLKELIGDESDYKAYYSREESGQPEMHRNIEDEKGITRFAVFNRLSINQLESVILHETAISHNRRGIIHIGCSDLSHAFSILNDLPDFEYSKSRLFLISKKCEKDVALPNITYIFTDDINIRNYYFMIYLNEEYAYGIFVKKVSDDKFCGFHTSDSIFIENLIVKLQNNYLLQEQL